MNSNYNANMYLTPNDLIQVEDKIEELTYQIQEHIYNGESVLKNIAINDDLDKITLHLSFPRNAHEYISQEDNDKHPLIYTDKNNSIFYQYSNDLCYVGISISNTTSSETNDYIIYGYDINDSYNNPYLNYIRYYLPKGFGKVTAIYDNEDLYQYIKIYDDENIIPTYIPKTWSINEIPYIQYIDHIEQGVENLGSYFTKPIDWIITKEWLGTATLGSNNNYGVGSKGFSYQDINRWIHNLNLIEQEDMINCTIWNTDKTEYEWEGHSEWSDYKVQYEGDDVQYGGSDIYYEYVD